ncbi:MAG: PAS domain S-box protein [Deltaproteobacteria bacterium]|nr:PAS domain S-box protein [Deltaproteobacteria bacterium]
MAEEAVVEAREALEQPEPEAPEPPEPGEKEHRRELHLFNQIATITAHTLDLQEIINEILETVLAFFRIDAGFLLLWDPVRQSLTYAAARGLPQEYLAQLSGGSLEGLMEPSRSRAVKPLIIKDIRKDPRLLSSTFTDLIREDPAFRAVASIPLRYRDDIIGFLNLAAKNTRTFRSSRRQKYFLGILGNQIGLAIENARLYHQMRRSERRYRRIFEGSKDMIFVTDVEGRILDLNPAGVELLKFPSKAEALNLPHLREIFQDPRDWERFQLKVEVEDYIRDLELTLKPQSGGQVYALLTGIVRRNKEGRITGYEGILKNISERKLKEWELLREKKTTEGILEGLPVPTFVIDRAHRIIYWNRACEELTGFSRHEMVGTYRYWLPFYTHERPSMASLVVEQNIKALEKFFGDKNLKPSPNLPGAYEAYEHFPNFRGRERYLYHTASPIYDDEGRIQGAVQVILDMTKREQLARELTDSEDKFRRLVETSLDGIVLHRNLKLLYVNGACLEMFDYREPKEMLNRSLLKFVDPQYRPVVERWQTQLQRGASTPRIFEMKGVKKDGSKFDLEGVSFPTTYEGRPAIQTHIRDITHKKHLEEHLTRTEKLAALGQLAAGVAHEINNPLGGILVYSYLLLEDIAAGAPERTQVEKIVREATRCKEIVQGLLEFSRHMPSKMMPLSINAILEEAISLVEDHLSFQSIQLIRELDPHLPAVFADKSKLEQVFINLLMNGGESIQGEGRLSVKTEVAQGGDLALIRFTDTGPGIPEHLLSRLFDPFFTTKEVGKGVGLGLSISYGIIQKHMGRIYVERTGAEGTVFVIELPVHRESVGAALANQT